MIKKRGNGEGSIYQNGDKWEAQITVGYEPILDNKGKPVLDKNGKPKKKQIRKTFTGEKREDVREQLIAALSQKQQKQLP